MPTIKVVITGRVQGVGFRSFASDAAESLEIVGEVWNSWDGSVIAIAEHADQDVLDRFVAKLNNGPGWVDKVQSSTTHGGGYVTFRVTSEA